MKNKFALAWLISFGLCTVSFQFFQVGVETHSLSRVLENGYDAFGRSCLFLTFTSAFESFKMIVPTAIFCLLLSLALASLAVNQSSKGRFFFRAGLDTLSSLPGFLLALALSAFFPNSSWVFLFAALMLVFPTLTRFWESQILKMKSEDYVQAAVALGANSSQVFIRHLLPDLIQQLFAISPYLITRLLLVETSLSFLGLGTAPEHETWGRLLYQGKDYLLEAPWILGISSLPLCLTLFSFHLLSRNRWA